MADIRDILDLEQPLTPELTRESILGVDRNRKKLVINKTLKRPEGMHREVFALLYNDNKDVPPLFPTDTGKGYKQMKARLGLRKVRSWSWVAFKNPARGDDAFFYHWRRVSDDHKEYPFARFNKQIEVPSYTEIEYNSYLRCEGWSQAETDHLIDLAKRFDLRFIIMADRWNKDLFPSRTVEELKERFYKISSSLAKLRGEKRLYTYDADHEKRRKEQLKKLYERTTEQIEEEQFLLNELKKIEARKKERERKTQDLQKLISQADSQTETPKKQEKKLPKKKASHSVRPSKLDTTNILQAVESAGIKFLDCRSSGVTLRSHRMKLPASVGQKKSKAIEQMLQELNIELNPTPSEDICQNFNELRSDLVLLFELRTALSSCEFELQSLLHQYEALNPGKSLTIPPSLVTQEAQDQSKSFAAMSSSSSMDIIDVVGSPCNPNGV